VVFKMPPIITTKNRSIILAAVSDFTLSHYNKQEGFMKVVS